MKCKQISVVILQLKILQSRLWLQVRRSLHVVQVCLPGHQKRRRLRSHAGTVIPTFTILGRRYCHTHIYDFGM